MIHGLVVMSRQSRGGQGFFLRLGRFSDLMLLMCMNNLLYSPPNRKRENICEFNDNGTIVMFWQHYYCFRGMNILLNLKEE